MNNVAFYLALFLYGAMSVTSESNVFMAATEDNTFDYDSNEDILKHERYRRHVQAVTESVIEHILKELKKKYPNINNEMPKKNLSHVVENIRKTLRKMKQKKKNKKKKVHGIAKTSKKNVYKKIKVI